MSRFEKRSRSSKLKPYFIPQTAVFCAETFSMAYLVNRFLMLYSMLPIWARRCKSLSVNCLSSLRHHPSGVRRSEGERSEPSAAEPQRGDDGARAENWSRAGHVGFLLGCRKHIQHPKPHGPPQRS